MPSSTPEGVPFVISTDPVVNFPTTDRGQAEAMSPIGVSSFSDSGGGGALSTAWLESSSPASILLSAGVYIVSASIEFTLSPSASVLIQAHLFDQTGAAFGNAQGSNRRVPSGGDQSFMAEFTRRIVVPGAGAFVRIRRHTSAVGGTQSSAVEHLIAQRVR